MNIKQKNYRPAWRIRKAYGTAAIVMLSYLRLHLLRKIMGKRWKERRIQALHLKNAYRVKNAILELKGLFIKIGQMLSILGNFLPEAFQKPLDELQDQMPQRPMDEVRTRILNELGQAPESLFAKFDEKAIASASIGQAHRATLHTGEKVVVKVQHAHIEEIAEVDLRIIKKLIGLHGMIWPMQGLEYVYSQIRKMIEEELDFRREAESMQRIAENLKDEPGLVIPTVHPAFSSGRVLTTTWHEGVKITQLAQLDAWKINRRELASRLLQTYCRMVFTDGFYHADPHPGNVLVKPDGTLVLLDFGAVAPLSREFREGLPRLIEAAVKNDIDAMIGALRFMGFLANGREADEMAEKMVEALRNFLQNEVEIEGLNFKDIKVNPFNNSLLDLIRDIGMTGISGTVQVPKDWILLNRMVTLLLGICSMLDPMLNPLDVVRPYAKKFVLGEKENLVTFVGNLLKKTVATSLGLPDELHSVLQKAKKGKLEVRMPDMRDSTRLLYLAVQQFMLLLLALAAAGAGIYFNHYQLWPITRWCFLTGALLLLVWLRLLVMGNRMNKRLRS